MNTLVTLVLIATPALIGFYLMFPDWRPQNKFAYYWYPVSAFCFMLYAVVISFIFIKLKILAYDAIAFLIPIAFVFAGLFLTAYMHITPVLDIIVRVIIGLVAIFLAIPLNILASNFKERKIQALRKLQKQNLRKK